MYIYIYIYIYIYLYIYIYIHIYISPSAGDVFFQLSGNGSFYHLSSSQKNYDQARADCQSKGAILTCPETVEELTAIREFLITRKSTTVMF